VSTTPPPPLLFRLPCDDQVHGCLGVSLPPRRRPHARTASLASSKASRVRRIDEAHFQLITEGMTEAEVEAIFGVPAGSYDWARPKTE